MNFFKKLGAAAHVYDYQRAVQRTYEREYHTAVEAVKSNPDVLSAHHAALANTSLKNLGSVRVLVSAGEVALWEVYPFLFLPDERESVVVFAAYVEWRELPSHTYNIPKIQQGVRRGCQLARHHEQLGCYLEDKLTRVFLSGCKWHDLLVDGLP